MMIKFILDKGETLPRMSTLINSITSCFRSELREWEISDIDHNMAKITLRKVRQVAFPLRSIDDKSIGGRDENSYSKPST